MTSVSLNMGMQWDAPFYGHAEEDMFAPVANQELVQLHQEALSLREACYLPAQLKKKSSMLTKFLDQDGRIQKDTKYHQNTYSFTMLYHGLAFN